jgi:tRNA pseudouridine55 synthase
MSRSRNPSGLSGLIVIDKELGWTSHDVVAKLRGMLRERRIGHAGTLDPQASGLLLVGVGPATRLLRYLQGSFKTYEGRIQFGATTSTLDAAGEITASFDMSGLDPDDVRARATEMLGDSMQIPPMVSALKVDGKRLHELARQGIEIDREARPITIESFDLTPTDDELLWDFRVRCSSGTYVRSIAGDLGAALGGGAHLCALRRTRNDRFSIDDAVTLEELAQRLNQGMPASELVMPPAQMLASLPAVSIDEAQCIIVGNGAALPAPAGCEEGMLLRILDPLGDLLGVYQCKGELLRADVVLPRTSSV